MEPDIPDKQPVMFYPFPLPRTQEVLLHRVIRTDDVASGDNLATTTSLRDEVVSALATGSFPTIVQKIQNYLPYLYGLACSFEADTESQIRFNSPLNFSWSSPVRKSKHKTGSRKLLTCYDFRFELIMILNTLGYSHYSRAREIISALPDDGAFLENVNAAALELRKAAGLFEHVCDAEIPRWQTAPPQRPMECVRNVAKALSLMCLATAQELAIKKALLGATGTSKSVLAKLSIEVYRMWEAASRQLRSPSDFKTISPNLLDFVDIQVSLNKAVALKLLAQSYAEQEKYGHAVSFGKVALKHLDELDKPKESGALGYLNREIQESDQEIRHRIRVIVLHNEHVHVQKEIDAKSLPLPEGKCLVKAETFGPPRPAYTELN